MPFVWEIILWTGKKKLKKKMNHFSRWSIVRFGNYLSILTVF